MIKSNINSNNLKTNDMKTSELSKGTKVTVSDTLFCNGFDAVITSDGITTDRGGDPVYEVRRLEDNTIFNVIPETVKAI